MLLRAMLDLSNGIARGQVFKASRLSDAARETLLRQGKVTLVSAPPVAVVPELAEFAPELTAAGITTAAEVLEAADVPGLDAAEFAALRDVAEAVLSVDCVACQTKRPRRRNKNGTDNGGIQ